MDHADKTSATKINPTLQDALFLTAVFNSCINPLVYGGFYIKSLRKSQHASGQQYSQHSTVAVRSTVQTQRTYTGNDNIDKQQQTPRYKREGSYKDKIGIFSSSENDSKKREKVVNCKEFQVVVTDYS